MSNYDFSSLQNGSDIRGVALDGVEGETVNLDKQVVTRLASGFIYWLSAELNKAPDQLTITIGRDPRLSGEALAAAFAASAASYGTKVIDCGLASTPAMFMSTIFSDFDADGAVMITASHLPFNRNGLKFFSKNGGLDKGDITDIIVFAESEYIINSLNKTDPSEIVSMNLMSQYSAHLRALITEGTGEARPLAGMRIAVDAGNGSGGFYATQVLEPLGADISASRYLEPDGSFPNHAPNPENKEAMASITGAVSDGGCDLGLIFDTDVDRSSAVDEKGREINRNGIVAMAAALISDKYPGTTVVTDSITSNELSDFLENSLKLKHLRFKRGYRNVINKAIELNNNGIDSQLAIETSGHAAYKDNYFLDDGAFLATRIVIHAALLRRQGLPISSVISDLRDPAESIEIRLPIHSDDFAASGGQILAELSAWAAAPDSGSSQNLQLTIVEPNFEGVRVAFSGAFDGWFLLRKSLHDPIMPLNIESETSGGCNAVRQLLRECLSSRSDLDIKAL